MDGFVIEWFYLFKKKQKQNSISSSLPLIQLLLSLHPCSLAKILQWNVGKEGWQSPRVLSVGSFCSICLLSQKEETSRPDVRVTRGFRLTLTEIFL